MTLLGKKSIKIDGVVDFEFAPFDPTSDAPGGIRENKIAFWTPEVQNQPARVTIMNLPSRVTVRSKNLFNVHDVRHSSSLLLIF